MEDARLEMTTTAACRTFVVAKDGIFVPGKPYETSFPLLVPGGRIDLAIRCDAEGNCTYKNRKYESNRSLAPTRSLTFARWFCTFRLAQIRWPRDRTHRITILKWLRRPSFTTERCSTLPYAVVSLRTLPLFLRRFPNDRISCQIFNRTRALPKRLRGPFIRSEVRLSPVSRFRR